MNVQKCKMAALQNPLYTHTYNIRTYLKLKNIYFVRALSTNVIKNKMILQIYFLTCATIFFVFFLCSLEKYVHIYTIAHTHTHKTHMTINIKFIMYAWFFVVMYLMLLCIKLICESAVVVRYILQGRVPICYKL